MTSWLCSGIWTKRLRAADRSDIHPSLGQLTLYWTGDKDGHRDTKNTWNNIFPVISFWSDPCKWNKYFVVTWSLNGSNKIYTGVWRIQRERQILPRLQEEYNFTNRDVWSSRTEFFFHYCRAAEWTVLIPLNVITPPNRN